MKDVLVNNPIGETMTNCIQEALKDGYVVGSMILIVGIKVILSQYKKNHNK